MSANQKQDPDGKQAVEIVISKKAVASERIQRCLEFMKRDITFGKSWKIDDLANELGMEPESIQFALSMSEVNRVLERDGYHITTRGKHGQQYFVESIDRSSAIAYGMNSDAMRTLRRAVTYLHGVTSNHAEKLSESQKRKLEKQSEIIALRYVLASRIR